MFARISLRRRSHAARPSRVLFLLPLLAVLLLAGALFFLSQPALASQKNEHPAGYGGKPAATRHDHDRLTNKNSGDKKDVAAARQQLVDAAKGDSSKFALARAANSGKLGQLTDKLTQYRDKLGAATSRTGSAPQSVGVVGEFVDSGLVLPDIYEGSVAWGDFNNDGKLDFLICGVDINSDPITRLYRNDGSGTFTYLSGAGFTDSGSDVPCYMPSWGDYNNDGYLDMLITGGGLFLNNGDETFTYIDPLQVFPVLLAPATWVDYNDDGLLDIFSLFGILRNEGDGTFAVTSCGCDVEGIPLDGAWGDYDNDGFPDVVVSGYDGSNDVFYTALYHNNGDGTFTEVNPGQFIGVDFGARFDWGDYDNDGDLDLLMGGPTDPNDATQTTTKVYRNNGGGSFTDAVPGIIGKSYGESKWGDYDNDGLLDILISTDDGSTGDTQIYHNDDGDVFTQVAIKLPATLDGSLAWGDYDNDGKLDFLLSGDGACGCTPVNALFHNEVTGISANTAPTAPDGLTSSSVGASSVTLHWDATSDTETPDDGLSYNLRIGTSPGGADVFYSHAKTDASGPDGPNGFRRVPQRGPFQVLTVTLVLTPATTYYWSVQAVDGGFVGSPFATEASFTTDPGFINVSNIIPGLPTLYEARSAWGDYDNDGKLDLMLAGYDGFNDDFTRLYRNTGSGFQNKSNLLPGLEQVEDPTFSWGDYDNDGRLDLFMTGDDDFNDTDVVHLYRNRGTNFEEKSFLLPGIKPLEDAASAWADYNGDGKLDLLVTGYNEDDDLDYSYLFRNTGSGFVDDTAIVAGGLPTLEHGSVAWGDYDNDGRPDFLINGYDYFNDVDVSRLYHNTGSGFEDASAIVTPTMAEVEDSSVAWGDYDNDGLRDFMFSGYDYFNDEFIATLYHNTGSGFEDASASIPGLVGLGVSSADWGDYDSDGKLDLLLGGAYSPTSGLIPGAEYTFLYHNTGSGFEDRSDLVRELPQVADGQLSWADYDSDGRLDFFMMGGNSGGSSIFGSAYPYSRLYHNVGLPTNAVPAVPSGLTVLASGATTVTLGWTPPADDHTPTDGLSYNLRVGTTINGQNILAPMSKVEGTSATGPNGYRRIPARGPIQPLSYTLSLNPGATYYWSVQAVDTSFGGSPFATSQAINFRPDMTVTQANSFGVFPAVGSSGVITLTVRNGGLNSASFATGKVILNDDLPFNNVTYGAPTLIDGGGVTKISNVSCPAFVAGKLVCTASGPVVFDPGGQFQVTLSVSASVAGTYSNPRSGGVCKVDPGLNVAEADETNNNCNAAAVTVYNVQPVAWIDPVGVTPSGNSITRSFSSNSWGAGASSSKGIASGLGYVEAQIGAASDTAAFGLSFGNDDQTPDDIDFAVYLKPDKGVVITQKGLKVCCGSFISYAADDTFRIAVEVAGRGGTVVNFYQTPSGGSATLLYSATSPTLNYPLRLDTAIWNPGGAIKNAYIAGVSLVSVPNRGFNYTDSCAKITWNNAAPANQLQLFSIGSVAPSIRRIAGAPGWNAGASSLETLSTATRPGSVQVTVPSTGTQYVAFGLNDSDNDGSLADIDFALYIYPPSNLLNVLYRGSLVKSVGDVFAGDILRTELTSTQFRVFRNNVPVFVGILGATNPSGPVMLDTSLNRIGSQLDNARICTGASTLLTSAEEALAIPMEQPKQATSAVSFSDVREGDYFYAAVQYLSSRGVVSGYADGTFRPNAAVTRGQLAKMVVLAAGGALENPSSPTFGDVSAQNPFYQYVETALARRLISGYADGTFRPNAAVTRGQLAKMVVLGMLIPLAEGNTTHFADVTPSNTFYRYIETARSLGLVSGYADGTFRPGAGATRAQIAKIVYAATQVAK